MTISTHIPPITRLNQRLLSIDALRGLVILLMLLDHVRETFFLHRQVADPMDIESTEPALFFSRTLAHLCAPVFILLTGLSAYLYGQSTRAMAMCQPFYSSAVCFWYCWSSPW